MQKVFAETNTILEQSVYDYTFIRNSTDFNSKAEKFNSYYLLAGEKNGLSLFSKIHVNTPSLPKSDVWKETNIESAKLKLLVVLSDGSSDKYFLTARVCTDEFRDKLNDRWLSGSSKARPFSENGEFQVEGCTRSSPQDSVIISKNDVPKIYELDVTNLTRELIELGSTGIVYVITATPLNEEPQDYSKLPKLGDGLVGIASKSALESYGSNTVATLSLSYTVSPTQFSENFNTGLVVLPGFLGVIGPIIFYFYKQNKERKDILKRATNSILEEISGNEEALTGKRGYQIIEYNTSEKPSRSIRYTNAFLDEDAYNSLITSGQFNHLVLESQRILRELYTRIKDHNEVIRYTNEIEDKISLGGNKETDILTRYDSNLTILELEILNLLPTAKRALTNKL